MRSQYWVGILCASAFFWTGCGDELGTPGGHGAANPAPSFAPSPGSALSEEPAVQEAPPAADQEEYKLIAEQGFQDPRREPLSTFSIDVDTASYTNARRYLQQGQWPPPEAVRIEEFINYFDYDYPAPPPGRPFSVSSEVASCPWAPHHRLLRLGIQGYEVESTERPPCNLVFLVDVSGSMNDSRKLPLVQRALEILVQQLTGRDHVGIVTYAGESGIALAPTPGDQRQAILSRLSQLQAGGSTNGAAGIQTAYQLASEHFDPAGINRILICSDGDFNVGITRESELLKLIEQQRERGIALSVLGFGMGNYKDNRMEMLADTGNGNYAYLDTEAEARKVLERELLGTLLTIAKDVKLQVEFNPRHVKAYRLIGYDNRRLAAEDFLDDQKDAGEIGAGHRVTALYELIPADSAANSSSVATVALRYQEEAPLAESAETQELLTLHVRYKDPQTNTPQQLEFRGFDSRQEFAQASPDFRFAAAVAGFGLKLRQSEFQGDVSWEGLDTWVKGSLGPDPEGFRQEFMGLVQAAKSSEPNR